MDFASGLLARVKQTTKAAQDAKRRQAASEAMERRRAAEARAAAEKDSIRREADRMLRRSQAPARRPISKLRRQAARKPAARKSAAAAMRPPAPRVVAPKPAGPPKPLPGMEFVVRREKKKGIRVPYTSDYSDLFGEDYLKGIDLKCVNDMKDESAKATEEAKEIIAARRAKAERLRREAMNIEAEVQRRGIKGKDRDALRRKAAEQDWVTVETPPAPGEKLDPAKLPPPRARSASATSSAPKSKKEVQAITKAKLAERSAALKQRILAASGGATVARSRDESSGREPEERISSGKRKRSEDRGRDRSRDHSRDRSRDRRSSEVDRRDRSKKRGRVRERDSPRYGSRYDRGYNSEDWSDYGDDDDEDDEDEDLFGIDALDREEERSAKLAALEDKRERIKDSKRRKEKEKRRNAHESGQN